MRYEATQYRPLNEILGHVFPHQGPASIQPHAKLRPTLGPSSVNPPQGVQVYTDLMYNRVTSRTAVVGHTRGAVVR
jgi:hypothetical protein